jgi:hypothetical protein
VELLDREAGADDGEVEGGGHVVFVLTVYVIPVRAQ